MYTQEGTTTMSLTLNYIIILIYIAINIIARDGHLDYTYTCLSNNPHLFNYTKHIYTPLTCNTSITQ